MLYSCSLVLLSTLTVEMRSLGLALVLLGKRQQRKVLKHTAQDKGTPECPGLPSLHTAPRLFYTPQIGSSLTPFLFPSARLDSLLTPQVQRSQLGLS